jgi:hypothetical protein
VSHEVRTPARHSVISAERHHVVLVAVTPEARMLEAALEIADLADRIINSVAAPAPGHRGLAPRRRSHQ